MNYKNILLTLIMSFATLSPLCAMEAIEPEEQSIRNIPNPNILLYDPNFPPQLSPALEAFYEPSEINTRKAAMHKELTNASEKRLKKLVSLKNKAELSDRDYNIAKVLEENIAKQVTTKINDAKNEQDLKDIFNFAQNGFHQLDQKIDEVMAQKGITYKSQK